jgi:hypothetical protein
MVKFPNPPPASRLAELSPRIKPLWAGAELWRIYFRSGRYPGTWNGFRIFGPSDARFDHHLPPAYDQSRGMLYGATEITTCVAEVFQNKRILDRHQGDPWLAGLRLEREVPLHDLTGTWPTAAGASMAINTGTRPRAQKWSRAIYESYMSVQAIWYCSSMHANRPAILLYERAHDALPAEPFFHRALADPLLFIPLKNAAAGLGYDFA